MENIEKAVVRFNSGKIIKGFVRNFKIDSDVIFLEENDSLIKYEIPVNELKAIFFVRTFEGDREYREKKTYSIRKSSGRRVYIKFKDGESMMGFISGKIPWEKGFFISRQDERIRGFYLTPADSESNNIKVFVVGLSIKDMTLMP